MFPYLREELELSKGIQWSSISWWSQTRRQECIHTWMDFVHSSSKENHFEVRFCLLGPLLLLGNHLLTLKIAPQLPCPCETSWIPWLIVLWHSCVYCPLCIHLLSIEVTSHHSHTLTSDATANWNWVIWYTKLHWPFHAHHAHLRKNKGSRTGHRCRLLLSALSASMRLGPQCLSTNSWLSGFL